MKIWYSHKNSYWQLPGSLQALPYNDAEGTLTTPKAAEATARTAELWQVVALLLSDDLRVGLNSATIFQRKI